MYNALDENFARASEIQFVQSVVLLLVPVSEPNAPPRSALARPAAGGRRLARRVHLAVQCLVQQMDVRDGRVQGVRQEQRLPAL